MKKTAMYLALFLRRQQGAYSIMMALISVFLLLIIGFTVDSTGALLEKARLAEALDQSAIAIVTENNEHRNDDARLKDKNSYLKRDKEVIKAYINNYIDSQTTVSEQAIAYECKKPINMANNDQAKKMINNGQRVTCQVSATVQRNTFLPLSFNHEIYIPQALAIGGVAKAIKHYEVPIPQDVMFVVDFSSVVEASVPQENDFVCNRISSNLTPEKHAASRARFCKNPTGRELIYKTMNQLFDHLLVDNDEKNTLGKSRIGLTAFAFGAQRLMDKSSQCVMPVMLENPKITDNYLEFVSKYRYRLERIQGYPKELIEEALRKHTVVHNNPNDDHWGYRVAKYLPLYLGIYPPLPSYDLQGELHLNKPLVGIRNTLDSIKDLDYNYKPSQWLNFDKIGGVSWTAIINNILGNLVKSERFLRGACLSSKNVSSTGWFDRNQGNEFRRVLQSIEAGMGKSTLSGLIVGTEAMTKTNDKATPEKVGTNTQRIMVIVDIPERPPSVITYPGSYIHKNQWSGNPYNYNFVKSWVIKNSRHYRRAERDDYIDVNSNYAEQGLRRIMPSMINMGLCDRIREKLDSLQDPHYEQVASKIVYIGISSAESKEKMPNYKMWEKCVGKDNIYMASDEKSLLNEIKEALKPKLSDKKSKEVGENIRPQ